MDVEMRVKKERRVWKVDTEVNQTFLKLLINKPMTSIGEKI